MILALDAGTTAAKSVLFSREGKELLVSEKCFPTHSGADGRAEQDASLFMNAVREVLSAAGAAASGWKGEIDALVISSQGGSTLFCDDEGTPLAPVITWLDRRAAGLVDGWSRDGRAERFRELSGWTPQPGLPAPVLAWFAANRPGLPGGAKRIASVHDWLIKMLTGEWITNPSCAAEMLLVSRKSGQWDAELCAMAGDIDPGKLSRIASSFDFAGTVSPEAAGLWGLPAGLPVVNGGQDHCCEAYALGMNDPGQALLACGTAWVLNIALPDSRSGEVPAEMDLNFHIPRGVSIASRFLGGFGGTMEWWLREFRAGGREEMERQAALVPPGCGGLRFSPVGTGPGRIEGLGLEHGLADLSRALMEGTAFVLRDALKPLSGTSLEPGLLWMVGGAAKSSLWSSIIGAVCAVPVMLFNYSHGPALGAAMIAAEKLGWVSGNDEARELFEVKGREVNPPEEWKHMYREALL